MVQVYQPFLETVYPLPYREGYWHFGILESTKYILVSIKYNIYYIVMQYIV